MISTFYLNGDLPELLHRNHKGRDTIGLEVTRRTSIKDMLESIGLPHTEIGALRLADTMLDFSHIVEPGREYVVQPVPEPWDVTVPTVLRPDPLPGISFVVDINVGRLAKYLRASGFDVLFDPRWSDKYIASLMKKEKRILLTRDRGLLMRKQVEYGRYVRMTEPAGQLQEVLRLFGLKERIRPFTRCLECNEPLVKVRKQDVYHLLEPLTRKYYDSFSRCPGCGRVYWSGSHIERMRRLFRDYEDC